MEEKLSIISGGTLRNRLEDYIISGKIDEAKKMFSCNADIAKQAIEQYNASTHKIMNRANKKRVDKSDYKTCKLPRNLQAFVNEIATFMMFGQGIEFILDGDISQKEQLKPAFDAFIDFTEKIYFDERMREAKRIAGAETEAAKLFTLYTNSDNKPKIVCQVLANSKEQKLYTLFNQFDELVAFAVGYFLKNEENQNEEFFDIYTSNNIFKCTRKSQSSEWLIDRRGNPFNKIPVIYYKQSVEWEGAQERIDRLEWVDSKRGDTNEYFGDPYLCVSQDVVQNRLADPQAVGKVIAMDGENSTFKFVAPPDCGENIENEKTDLYASILQDTLTPELTYKTIMGLGTLSGEAMRRITLPGYIKRAIRAEIYSPLIRREINLIKTILCSYVHADDYDLCKKIKEMKIKFSYRDPFIGGIDDNSEEIATLMGAGAMSIETAVNMNRFVQDKDAEIERIMQEKARLIALENNTKNLNDN